jgi:hypothetical protein
LEAEIQVDQRIKKEKKGKKKKRRSFSAEKEKRQQGRIAEVAAQLAEKERTGISVAGWSEDDFSDTVARRRQQLDPRYYWDPMP